MDFENLGRAIRRGYLVIAVTAPVLIVSAFLLRNAGEGARQALGLAYFFGTLVIFMVVQARAERREERRDQ
jgi:hypothetical protein